MDAFWSMESQLIQLLYGQKLLSPVYLSLRQKHERPELQKEMVLTVSPFITIPPTGHHKKNSCIEIIQHIKPDPVFVFDGTQVPGTQSDPCQA